MMVREGSIERPDLEQFSNTPMFNTKAVVQQTGVPAATLRAWERRYKLLSPERAENAYRLYSEQDIVLIHWLKERVDSGMAISQAIALFKHKSEIEPVQKEQEPFDKATSVPSTEESSNQEENTQSLFQVALPQDEQRDTGRAERETNDGINFSDWPLIGEDAFQKPVEYPSTYNMRVVRERLVEAFNMLDEPMANMIMGSMLAIYPIEQVCMELITPTMWQVGKLWAEGSITVSVEHFASNFFRALLTNLFHITPSMSGGPMAIVCCAPGEPHELAPLILALFLRRKGIRVVYLGQSIEISGLVQTIKRLSPGLVCVSLTMPAYLSAVINLGHQMNELPQPRPIFAFGGQVFAQYENVIPQIPGIYLGGDLHHIVEQLYSMLHKRTDSRN